MGGEAVGRRSWTKGLGSRDGAGGRPPRGGGGCTKREHPGSKVRVLGSTSLCKPSSVSRSGHPGCGGDHSSRTTVTRRLERPTRRLERAALDRLPTRPCSRRGLPCRPRYRGRGGLLPRRFTLAVGASARTAVSFLWHSPRRFRHRALPGIVLCGARTFLPSRPKRCADRRSPERRRPAECASSPPSAQGYRRREPSTRRRWPGPWPSSRGVGESSAWRALRAVGPVPAKPRGGDQSPRAKAPRDRPPSFEPAR